MAINITNFTKDVNNIQSLSDKPNETDGLTAQGLKEKFDQAGADIKSYINSTLIEELEKVLTTHETGIATNVTNINTNKTSIGTLANLNTTTKDSTVSAINEVNTKRISTHTYSTDEIEIGTWIDGKTVYRKVIQTTIGNLKTALNNISFETVIDIKGWYQTDYSYRWKINGYVPENKYALFVFMNNTGTAFQVNPNEYAKTTYDVIAIVEYTKAS